MTHDASGRAVPALPEESDEGVPSYFITFSDMMTLLFAFSVALLAMSSMMPEQRVALTASIRGSFPVVSAGAAPGEAGGGGATGGGVAKRGGPGGPDAGFAGPDAGFAGPDAGFAGPDAGFAGPDAGAVYRSIQERLGGAGAGGAGGVEIVPQRGGVLIRVNSALLFPSGSDQLHPDGERLVGVIARALADLPGDIRVEGHTDDVPIHTERFPSNWELSAARAVRVVRAFTETFGVASRRLMLAGYGEQHPLVPNDSPANRQRNRRVEVYLIDAPP